MSRVSAADPVPTSESMLKRSECGRICVILFGYYRGRVSIMSLIVSDERAAFRLNTKIESASVGLDVA